MNHDANKPDKGKPTTKGELTKDELKGAKGGAGCMKDPYLSIQKKPGMDPGTFENRRTGRVK